MSTPSFTEKPIDQHLDHAGPGLARPPSNGGSVQLEDVEPELHWRSWIVVVACLLYYMATLVVVVSVGFWLSAIEGDIGGAAVGLWLSQSFQVMSAVLSPIVGQVGDSCGRRYLMIVGLSFGCLGTIVQASAKSMNVAILGSCLFGFNFAVNGSAFSIVSEVTTRRWRPRAQAAMNVAGSVGVLVGTYCGAAFITRHPGNYPGWRDVFWLAFALLFTANMFFIFFYHPSAAPNPRGLSVRARVFETDLIGAVLFAFALVSLMIGLIWGGETSPWKSAQTLVPLLIGIFFIVVFGVYEYFFKTDGLMHHGMLANRNVWVSVFGMFVEGMIYITFNQYYGAVTGTLYEARTWQLCTRFGTFLFGSIAGSVVVQWYSYRFKRVKELLVGGYACFLISMIGMANLKADNNASSKLIILWGTLSGFGFSAPIALLIATAQLGSRPEHIGLASGLLISARSVGGAVGVAIATAVYQSKLKTALPSYIAAAGLKAGLPASSLATFVTGMATSNTTLAESAPGVTPAILEAGGDAVLHAFAYSFKFIWIVVIPFVLVALLMCFLLKGVDKDMNYIVDRPSEAIHHQSHAHIEAGTKH